MPAEYAVDYGKPPVQTRFQKGWSGNPGGKPGLRKTRRLRFAQMLDAAMSESTETVTATPCGTLRADMAREMVLDAVDGKTAAMRMIFSLFDALDAAEATPARWMRGLDDMLEQAEDLDAANGAGSPGEEDSQGIIEEEPLLLWHAFADEPPRSEAPASRTEAPADASVRGADFPSQGIIERRNTEEHARDVRQPEHETAVARKRWTTRGRPLAAALLSSAGDVSPPNIGMRNPAPLPDFSIRPRGQAAAAA